MLEKMSDSRTIERLSQKLDEAYAENTRKANIISHLAGENSKLRMQLKSALKPATVSL